jgi:hypothetical protein
LANLLIGKASAWQSKFVSHKCILAFWNISSHSDASRLCPIEHHDQEAGFQAQIKSLKAAGCEKVFAEQVSSTAQREQLEAALEYAREGDTLVVTKLDRLRSDQHWRSSRPARRTASTRRPFGFAGGGCIAGLSQYTQRRPHHAGLPVEKGAKLAKP